MTVAELIKLLSTFPQDARVVRSGYEGGYEDITSFSLCPIKLNVNNMWYYGPHASIRVVGGEPDEIAIEIE